jgi:hypothetical protein
MGFNCIMLDLETYGNSPGCAIASMGAIEFDPESRKKGKSLYLVINKQSCLDKGLKINQDTLDWWSKQPTDAQTVLKKAESDRIGEDNVRIESALIVLNQLIQEVPNRKVFSCGADFDLPILVYAFEACGVPLPWKFWNSRCHRTWKNLAPWVKAPNREVAHHALEDASDQVDHLFAIANNLRLKIR